MKIAIVINTSWNIFNFRLGLIRALLARQYEVHAIAPPDEYTEKLMRIGCSFTPIEMDNTGTNPVKDLALTVALYKIYKKVNPEIILHFTIKPNIYGSLAAKLAGIPVINNVSGLGTVFLRKSSSSSIAKLLYRLAFRFPQKVFFQNSDDQELFLNKKLVNTKITEVLPGSGIDIEIFKPERLEKNKVFTFLLIGRLIQEKGINEYVEAAEILGKIDKEIIFQILGAKAPDGARGISLATIESWASHGHVSYLGTTDDVRPYIHRADCVVLPSYREGTPRTLLEAASLGKPIIASNVPGCNHIVTHEYNGYLCKVKDAKDLAEKMLKMVHLDVVQREEMGLKSRRRIEDQYDEKFVIERYFQEIHEILHKKI